MSIARRVRGALGVAVTWAAVWGLTGAILSPYLRKMSHARPADSLGDYLFDAVWVGWYGLLAGAIFAAVLAVAARRRTFHDLSADRMAAWGAAAGVLFSAPPWAYMLAGRADGWRIEDGAYLAGIFVLSVGCATGSLLLARVGKTPPMLFSSQNLDFDGGSRSHTLRGRDVFGAVQVGPPEQHIRPRGSRP